MFMRNQKTEERRNEDRERQGRRTSDGQEGSSLVFIEHLPSVRHMCHSPNGLMREEPLSRLYK